jgi:hypothetical protein
MHNEDLHNLYSSLNITEVINSRQITWTVDIKRHRGDDICIKI